MKQGGRFDRAATKAFYGAQTASRPLEAEPPAFDANPNRSKSQVFCSSPLMNPAAKGCRIHGISSTVRVNLESASHPSAWIRMGFS